MAKLPNADQARIPEAKITRYLLSLTSRGGRAKARFFTAFGFTIEGWEALAEALRQHALSHEVAGTRETAYGVHYRVEGPLETPDGRNPGVRSVWKIERDDTIPGLITAYPLKEE